LRTYRNCPITTYKGMIKAVQNFIQEFKLSSRC
jgi:hypothetical protein